MANLKKAIVIGTEVAGNGVDDTFTLDLLLDPYVVLYGSGSGVDILNWFSGEKRVSQPVGISNPGSPNTVSLSGTIVTYTFAPSQIPTGQAPVEFTLLFD
jgi:hypothetical protein